LENAGLKAIVILFNPISGYKIVFCNMGKQKYKSSRFLLGIIATKFNRLLYSIFFPFAFIIDYVLVARQVDVLAIKYMPKVGYVDNTFIARYFAKLRKNKKLTTLIYASFDWFGDNENKTFNPLRYLFSRLFLSFDTYVCKISDIVLCHTDNIRKARRKYLGVDFPINDVVFNPNLTLVDCQYVSELSNPTLKNKIIFLGNATDNSGLDITLNAIRGTSYKMCLAGPKNHIVDNLYQSENSINFEYMGFANREDMCLIFSDILVGLNLITSENTHTSYTIPSKVMDYLRYGIPVVITKNIGPFSDVVRQYEIGHVVDVDVDEYEILNAIDDIANNQKQFKKNISIFFEAYQFDNIVDVITL